MASTNRRRRDQLIAAHGSACHWCGKITHEDLPVHDPFRRTLDHVLPKVKGGGNEPWNLVISCYGCNQRRAREWMEDQLKKDELVRIGSIPIWKFLKGKFLYYQTILHSVREIAVK